MIIINEIRFENPSLENGIQYQDIIYRKEIIGCLISRSLGILLPIEESFQCFGQGDHFVQLCKKFKGIAIPDCERDGFYFRFKTLEDFIEFLEAQE